ncbi:MAG: APC family permease [Bacillota bacterium]|nr:APC family permease [Bacillota bacterium]
MDNERLPSSGGEGSFKKVLGFWPLVFFGFIAMSPTAGATYYPDTQGTSNGYTWIGYVIASVLVVLTVLSYQIMVSKKPSAGSAYAYSTIGLGAKPGFIVGWTLLIDYALTPMFVLAIAGMYLNAIFPAISIKLWVIIIGIMVLILSLVGVKIGVLVENALGIFLIVFMIIFMGAGLFAIVHHADASGCRPELIYDSSQISWNGTLQAASLGILSFVGFDAISTLAEETKLSVKKFTHTMMVAALLQAFCLIVSVIIMALAKDWKTIPADNFDTSYLYLLREWTSPAVADVLVVIKELGIVALIVAFVTASSRVLYAMGRSEALPKKVFGHLSVKFGTPTWGSLIVCLISIFGALFLDWGFIASIVSFGACIGFIGVNLSVFVQCWVREKDHKVFRHLIAPLFAAVAIFYVLIHQSTACLIVGVIWMIIGVIVLIVRYKTHPVFREALDNGTLEM